jgi:uncharacterized protein (DUF885 family)
VPNPDELTIAAAQRVVDDAWNELQRAPHVQARIGHYPAGLPDVSYTEAQRRSAVGCRILRDIESLDSHAFPSDLALTLRLARFQAHIWSKQADWYWLVIDPMGIGCFGLFLPTAYCGGWLLNAIRGRLTSFAIANDADADDYLILVAEYARLIDQFSERTVGQAQRGVRMPKVQVLQARALLAGYKKNVRETFGNVSARTGPESVAREIDRLIGKLIDPAFDRALAVLSDGYLGQAPDDVGIGQYPGGVELYAELVRIHTTLDLTPEQVHEQGHEGMSRIQVAMSAIRQELGYEGDKATFPRWLMSQAKWHASSAEEVVVAFQRCLQRITPLLGSYFSTMPRTSCGVAPLPEALESSMTFGFYDPPRGDRDRGIYFFNADNMTKKPLVNIPALAYHELLPGHHLQFSSQQENETLHPFRRFSFVTAYAEGWAEYAATFAGELGMYELPEERYGRLMMDALLTSRLVVDTGMNVMDWSLERAQDYMREYSGMEVTEIRTESVRYSCDIPAQALAYKVGDAHIIGLREQMRQVLGARFSSRGFHDAVLNAGAIPLTDLAWYVGRGWQTA